MAFGKQQPNTTFVSSSALAAEKERLNRTVSEDTKNIDAAYLQIGKQFVEEHKEDIPEKYEEPIRSITQLNHRLSLHYTQLQLLNGFITCPKCGNNAPDGSLFCNRCGIKLPPLDTTQFLTCKNCGKTVWEEMGRCVFCGATIGDHPALRCEKCGKALPEGTSFCTACGTPVSAPKSILVEPPETDTVVCPNCGTTLPSGLLYCIECGQKL